MNKAPILKFAAAVSFCAIAIFTCYPVGYYILKESIPQTDFRENTSYEAGKVGIFLINLDRSPDRLRFIRKFTDDMSYDFNRISAIQGDTLEPSEIKKLVDYPNFFGHPSPGELGCYLSHVKTWKAFLESEYEYALILEDDVGFGPKHLEKTIEELKYLTNFWDLVKFNNYIKSGGKPSRLLKLESGSYLSMYFQRTVSAGAYLINRKAARNLVQKSLPMRLPIDLYFNRDWELDIKFTGIERPPIAYQLYGDSEIENLSKSPDIEAFVHPTFSYWEGKRNMLEGKIWNFQSKLIRRYKNYMLYRKLKKELEESED